MNRYQYQILPDASELNRRVEEGETMAAIAREYGVSRAAVSAAIRKAGFDPMAAKYPPVDIDRAITDYKSGMSLEECAVAQGVSKTRMLSSLEGVELERRPKGWGSGRNRTKNEDEYVKLYAEGVPVTMIAVEMRTNPAIVRRILQRNGVYEPDRERKRVSPEQREEIIRKYRKGQSKRSISRELKFSQITVDRIIREAGAKRGSKP